MERRRPIHWNAADKFIERRRSFHQPPEKVKPEERINPRVFHDKKPPKLQNHLWTFSDALLLRSKHDLQIGVISPRTKPRSIPTQPEDKNPPHLSRSSRTAKLRRHRLKHQERCSQVMKEMLHQRQERHRHSQVTNLFKLKVNKVPPIPE